MHCIIGVKKSNPHPHSRMTIFVMSRIRTCQRVNWGLGIITLWSGSFYFLEGSQNVYYNDITEVSWNMKSGAGQLTLASSWPQSCRLYSESHHNCILGVWLRRGLCHSAQCVMIDYPFISIDFDTYYVRFIPTSLAMITNGLRNIYMFVHTCDIH